MPEPKDNVTQIVLMLENRSFGKVFGYLTIDRPNKPGDSIDTIKGDGMNVDSIPSSRRWRAQYAGDYRVDPWHHFPDVTYQFFEKDQVTLAKEFAV